MNTFNKVVPFVFLLLASCATQKAEFVPARPSNEKGSVVYLYRASQYSNFMLAPDINIKGAEGNPINIGKLATGEYKRVYLIPGRHEISLDAIKHYAPGETLMLDVKPETVNYLRLDASLKFETGTRYKSYIRKFNFHEIEEPIALDEIASCRNVDSKSKSKDRSTDAVTDAATNEISDSDEGAYFSTDKTSDPFSRNK